MNFRVFGQGFGSARRIAGTGVERVFSAVCSLVDSARLEDPLPRDPYVQGVTTTSATITWVGNEPGVGTVEYGETLHLGRELVDTKAGRRHAVALTDLEPGTTYHYRVAGIGGSSVASRFRTAAADEGSRFTFAVVGDSGDRGGAQLEVAGLLGHLRPDLILHAGDVVYPRGAEKDYDKRFFAPYRSLIKEVPIFPVLGTTTCSTGTQPPSWRTSTLPSTAPVAPSASTPSTGQEPTSSP